MTNRMMALFLLLAMAGCNNNADTSRKAAADKDSSGHNTHSMPAMAEGGNYSDSVNNGLIASDTMKGSPHRTAMATINGAHIHIEYASPGVKGRTIWGGLVPYDKVWVTGAHKATSIQFSKDVEIGGKKIPAGQYALFTIPGKDKWTAIINSHFDQHLADDYKESEDLARVEVKPEPHAMTERLTYTVEKGGDNEAFIAVQWEKVVIRIPVKVN